MGSSETMLLNMLNISPFSFGLVIQQVFDNGSIYNPVVLDITEETAFPLPGGEDEGPRGVQGEGVPRAPTVGCEAGGRARGLRVGCQVPSHLKPSTGF